MTNKIQDQSMKTKRKTERKSKIPLEEESKIPLEEGSEMKGNMGDRLKVKDHRFVLGDREEAGS